jgi:hypothetical protein
MDLHFRRFASAWEVQQVKPTDYRVELMLDPDKETFSGYIDTRLEIERPVQVLWLNANENPRERYLAKPSRDREERSNHQVLKLECAACRKNFGRRRRR